MKRKLNRNNSLFVLALAVVAVIFTSCETGSSDNFSFNYNTILNREFRNNIGKVVPVAYEKAIETDGDISADGNYMYYTSNRENGNFDIFLRDLNDITTVRLTSHAAKDGEPAISPDGKYLAYVSARENPEGDIYLLKVSPESIIKKAKKSVSATVVHDADSKNLTQLVDSSTGAVRIVRNASPAWSPDGKQIAFMSRRGGGEDIWLMDRDGGSLSQFTQGGGLYPRFSADGNKIIFISYKAKNSQGDIYIKNSDGGSETRIDVEAGIKLFPAFLGTNDEIIYTLIQTDTNKDGILSLKDDSVIMYYNIRTKASYPVTLPSNSSFNAKWLMPPWSKSHEGILLYSDIQDDNINVNIIPGYGIIPKKTKASYQYTLAESYNEEYDDLERYLLALKRVYYYFGDKKDDDSIIYTARALGLLSKEYTKLGSRKETAEVARIFESFSKNNNLYVKAQYELIKSGKDRNKAAASIKKIITEAKSNKNATSLLPYLEEDLAKIYIENGDRNAALTSLSGIKEKYPQYEGIASVHMEYALLMERAPSAAFSDSTVYTIESGRNVQKVRMYNHIISMFEKDRNHSQKLTFLNSLIETNKEKKLVSSLCYYLSALTYQALNRNDDMIKALEQSAALSNINDLMHYKAHLLLGNTYMNRDKVKTEHHMALAITNYKRYFADNSYRNRVRWLIDFYEDEGNDVLQSYKYGDAVSVYDKYRKLIKYLYAYKFFPDIYSIFGPRAHVLYIDAVHILKREKGLEELEKEYETDLFKARIESDKAYIYGLAYIYTKKALDNEDKPKEMFFAFSKSMENIDWAQFIDDSFIDPYILKSWIYQYADLRRTEDNASLDSVINKYFPPLLFEQNISILERALASNDEALYPEHEGNIHLNMGNNYFLLVNYPLALTHYEQARKYKKNFESKINQALFCFHMAYCYWQNDDLKRARVEMERAEWLYRSFTSENNIANYAFQFYTIQKYYALFSRMEGDYEKAIEQYQNILSHCSKYKIRIDRARYNQEIAYCYQELGQYDQAVNSLQVAEGMLKRYPDDEPTYKMNIRFFNLFRVSVFDMGVDTFVIGDNKIFYALDTRSKKLLNFSMQESIELKHSDYEGAIKYLEKKIDILKDRKNSVDKESLIITHNNLGYYNAMSGNYEKAISHFNTAWDLAKKDGFTEGSFTVIMNFVNMYAYMLENGVDQLNEASLNSLRERVSAYRDSYASETYNSELELLKADADKLDRKVSQEEINNLKKDIEARTREVYYKIDISLAVLDYYRAELKRISLALPAESGTDGAYRIYNDHKDLYNIYKASLDRFTGAASQRSGFGDVALEIKLLLNMGNCYVRLGSFEEANAAFLEARTLALDFKNESLLFETSYALGVFLKENGGAMATRGSLSRAESSLKEALTYIRKTPLTYTGARASRTYDALLEVLIAQSKWDEAFAIDEEHTAFTKVMLARLESEPLLKAYKTMGGAELGRKPASGTALIKFIRIGNTLHIWKWGSLQSPNGLVHSTEKAMEKGAVKKASSSFNMNKTPLYIVYNESLFNMLQNEPDLLSGIKVTFVTSASQATSVKNDALLNTLYYGGTGLGEVSSFAQISEGGRGEPEGYDVIADNPSSPIFTAAKLFQSKLNPAVLVVYPARNTFKDVFKTVEAAHYAGASAVIVCLEPATANVSVYLGKLLGGTDTIMADSDSHVAVFGTPLKATDASGMADIYRSYLDKLQKGQLVDAGIELRRYKKMIDIKLQSAGSNMDKELYHAESVYMNDALTLFLLQNNITGARALCENPQTKTLSAAELTVYKIYLEFYEGNADAAVKLLSSDNAIASQIENSAYKALTGLVSSASLASIQKDIADYNSAVNNFEKTKTSNGQKLCISASRMKMLLATYLEIGGYKKIAGEIISANERIVAMDDKDIAMVISVKASPQLAVHVQERKSKISNFINNWKKDPLSFTRTMDEVRNIAGVNSNSTAAIILLLTEDNRMTDITFLQELLISDLLDDVRQKSYSLDAIRLDLKLASLHIAEENFAAAWTILEALAQKTSGKGPAMLRKKILAEGSSVLISLKRFEEAYKMALQAEELIATNDTDYIPVQFILLDAETQATDLNAGKPRIETLLQKTDMTAYEKFMLRLFQSRIELKRLATIKNLKKEDGQTLEKLYLEALDIAGKNPSLFSQMRNRPLAEEIADAYIYYRMGIGDSARALNFAEVKKNFLAAIDFSDVSSEMARNSHVVRNSLISDVQSKLEKGSVIVYLIRNGSNVFVWVIDNKSANSTILQDVASKIEEGLLDYNNAVMRFADVSGAAKKIGEVFAPLSKYTAEAKTVYFVVDEFMERVPFEIFRGREGFTINGSLFFLPSLTAALNDFSFTTKKVLLFENTTNKQVDLHVSRLEKAVAAESGMQIITDGGSKAGIVHFLEPLKYGAHSLSFGDKPYSSFFKRGEGVYVRTLPVSRNSFAAYNFENGLSFCVINNAVIQEINGAYFLDIFYRELAKGSSVKVAFDKARVFYDNKNDYRHPAYWSFIRLYMNGL